MHNLDPGINLNRQYNNNKKDMLNKKDISVKTHYIKEGVRLGCEKGL